LHDYIFICFFGDDVGVELLSLNALTITSSCLALAFGSYLV